jgi:hypothetical protein
MKLVLLHGPPASGKFTVGRELAALTGFRFFHNHLVVDALLAVFEFGTPQFIALREQTWRAVFVAAAQARVAGLIFTFTPETTVGQDFIDWVFADLPRSGVQIISVALRASDDEIGRRIGNSTRKEFGKLTDPALYRSLAAAGTFSRPVIPRNDLVVDTARLVPAAAAREIAAAVAQA